MDIKHAPHIIAGSDLPAEMGMKTGRRIHVDQSPGGADGVQTVRSRPLAPSQVRRSTRPRRPGSTLAS